MAPSLKKNRFIRRILKHHLPLAIINILLIIGIDHLLNGINSNLNWQLSMSTAYIATVLLVITLLIGPVTRLRGHQPAVSSDLRRDMGIWCAIIGSIHVVTGIQIHMGNPYLYFFMKKGFPHHLVLRSDMFGFSNYTGLIATLLLLFLALLSNDLSLSFLGSRRWKSFQRWSYVLVGFIFAHAFLYQINTNRPLFYVIIIILCLAIILVFQVAGFFKTRAVLHRKRKVAKNHYQNQD